MSSSCSASFRPVTRRVLKRAGAGPGALDRAAVVREARRTARRPARPSRPAARPAGRVIAAMNPVATHRLAARALEQPSEHAASRRPAWCSASPGWRRSRRRPPRGARGDVLLVLVAGRAQVHVRVDEAGRDGEPVGLDRLGVGVVQVRPDLGDAPASMRTSSPRRRDPAVGIDERGRRRSGRRRARRPLHASRSITPPPVRRRSDSGDTMRGPTRAGPGPASRS